MNRMRKIVILSLMMQVAAFAQSGSDGATGLSFLKVGVDARAAGMGEAFSAVTDDAYATYWNPAGLLAAKKSNVVFMHNEWISDVRSEFGALQFAGEKSSVGFHVYSFNLSDIPVRTTPTASALEQTSANYISAGMSYARKFGTKMDIGITAKYLYEKIFFHSAAGYGIDIGLRYRLSPNLMLAGVIQNLGSMDTFQNESTKLPKIFRAGASYQLINGEEGGFNLLLAGDAVVLLDENTRFNIGAEAGLLKNLALRAGYMAGYDTRSFTVGAGIHKSFFRLDYSYQPVEDDLGAGHRFSLYLTL